MRVSAMVGGSAGICTATLHTHPHSLKAPAWSSTYGGAEHMAQTPSTMHCQRCRPDIPMCGRLRC